MGAHEKDLAVALGPQESLQEVVHPHGTQMCVIVRASVGTVLVTGTNEKVAVALHRISTCMWGHSALTTGKQLKFCCSF